MNGSRIYEYVMDEAEIRDFCLHAFWEQIKCSKKTGVRLLLILAAEVLLVPEAVVLTVLLLLGIFLGTGIYSYVATAKLLRGQIGSVWIEGDKLKARRRDYGEISCRKIQFIRRTKRLLMLGYMQRAGRPAWFMIPLRAFRDGQEVDRFLALLRSPAAQGNYYEQTSQCRAEMRAAVPAGQKNTGAERVDQIGQNTETGSPREYFRFQYRSDLERWVRLQKGAAELVNGGSLGRSPRTYGVMIWGSVMLTALVSVSYLVAKKLDWLIVCYGVSLTVLMLLKLFYTDPEKQIRKQLMSPEVAARACGLWQVSVAEEGVSVTMPADIKNVYLWTSLAWLAETEEAFYLFHQDKKHFIMIAKESFQSWDQVQLFHQICADHGIQKVVTKKARYVPLWLLVVMLVLCLLVLFGAAMVKIFLSSGIY